MDQVADCIHNTDCADVPQEEGMDLGMHCISALDCFDDGRLRNAICDKQAACGGAAGDCQAELEMDGGAGMFGCMRDDVWDPIENCIRDTACDDDIEHCFPGGAAGGGPPPCEDMNADECGEHGHCWWEGEADGHCRWHDQEGPPPCEEIGGEDHCAGQAHCHWNADDNACQPNGPPRCEDIGGEDHCSDQGHCHWNADNNTCQPNEGGGQDAGIPQGGGM